MGWESRGNGEYYYLKEREGNKVRSIYLGTGPQAEVFVTEIEGGRKEKRYVQKQKQLEHEKEKRIDAELEKGCRFIKNIESMLFLLAGYHQHKRQWRKIRNGKRSG